MEALTIDTANLFGVGAAAADAAATADAQLQKQVATLRQELQRLQKHVVYVEANLEEAQTALLVAGKRLAEQDAKMKTAEAKAKMLQATADEKLRVLRERLRSAPQVDKAVASLYIETRRQMTDRYGAPAMAQAELEATERASPLVNAAKLRLWVRRLFAVISTAVPQTQVATQQQQQQQQGAVATASIPRVMSFTVGGDSSVAGDIGDPGSPLSLDGSVGSFYRSPSRGVSFARDAGKRNSTAAGVLPSREEQDADLVAELRATIEKLRAEANEKQQSAFQFEQQCRLTADLARRDAANARQEVRHRDKTIEQLQAKLARHDSGAQHRVALQRAQDEIEETKKNMRVALQAKQQEIDVLKRNFAAELKDAQTFIANLRKQKNETAKLETQLRDAEEEKALLKGQLVRTDVRSLVEDRRRALKSAQEKQQRIEELEKEAQRRETSVKFLEATHKKMTDEYNAIFEAHYREQMERRKRQHRADEQAAATFIKGPNSELNLSYFRSRYLEVLEDLKATQRKMKHLILISHHDHLTFQKQKESLQEQLSVARTASPAMAAGASADQDELLSFEEWQLARDRSASTMPTVDTTSYRGYKPNQDLIDDTEDTRVTTESVRIAAEHVVVEKSFPHFGAGNEFGSPLESDALVRYKTTSENPHAETSTRALALLSKSDGTEGPPAIEATLLEDRSRRRKQPHSQHGRVFQFAAVGAAKMAQLPGALGQSTPQQQQQRPGSAMSSSSMKSRPLSAAGAAGARAMTPAPRPA